jgi:DNA-binding response OmpR family regulator
MCHPSSGEFVMGDIKCAVIADPYPNDQSRIASLLQQDFTCIPTGSLRETWRKTGEKVQQTSTRQQPILLILELNQPDGDGVELIRYMQADPLLRSVLVACVTYRSSIRDKLIALHAGADGYWVKPQLPPNFAGMMSLLQQSGYMARATRTIRSSARPGSTGNLYYP